MPGTKPSLRCVSLGPQHQGRDYGPYPQSRVHSLPGEAQARLNDFGMALLRWGFAPRPEFALFMPLDDSRAIYLLTRVAYLRQEALGPLVVSNGVLLSRSELELVGNRAHLLLNMIADPQTGPWTVSHKAVDVAAAVAEAEAERGAPPPETARNDLEILAENAPHATYQLRIEVTDGIDPWTPLSVILRSEMAFEQGLGSWATTATLEKKGRFDPGTLKLLAFAVDHSAPRAPLSLRLGAKGLEGPIPDLTPEARVHQILFVKSVTAMEQAADPELREVVRAAQGMRPRAGQEIRLMVRDTIRGLTAQLGLAASKFWPLMLRWSRTTAKLSEADSKAASMGIAAAFRSIFEQTPDRDDQVALLNTYLETVEPELRQAPQALPVAIVTGARLTEWLAPATIKRLIERGLGRSDPEIVVEPLRGRRYRADQVAAICEGARHGIAGDVDRDAIIFGWEVSSQATANSSADRSHFAAIADAVLRLDIDLLRATAATPGRQWVTVGEALDAHLCDAPGSPERDGTLAVLRGAIRGAALGRAEAIPAATACLGYYRSAEKRRVTT